MTKTRVLAVVCAGLLIAPPPYLFGQQTQPIKQPTSSGMLSPGQLDSLVAPLALYPDPILSQVLVASTYPLQIVQADRWLQQHSSLTGKPLADLAAKQPWDASIQALVMMPDVLKRLNQNLTWTSDLGNAVMTQQSGVMDAIQRMRQKAEEKGTLQSTPQQTVSTTTENGQNYIVIQPASPEVVYVPQYNPEAVYGAAPAYYPYPSMYYPPGLGLISWGAGFAMGAIWGGSWGNWGWNCGWGSRNVFVNNNFINRNNFNRASIGNGNRWTHNPRLGGGLNNPRVGHYGQAGRGNLGQRPTVGQVQQRLSQGNMGRPGQGHASRLGPGNIGGAGNRVGQGNGIGQGNRPGQGNRVGQGNRPSQLPSRGSANRISPGNNFGGGNRGGYAHRGGGSYGGHRGGGGFHGGGGFRGGGGGYRGGGGFRGGGGGFRGGGGGGRRGGGRRR